MKKPSELIWNVYRYSGSEKMVKEYNVFHHMSLLIAMNKWWKKPLGKEEFAEKLKGELLYYYCGKYEHEIVIAPFTPRITPAELDRIVSVNQEHIKKYGQPSYSVSVCIEYAQRFDVYEQIMINWDRFLDYVWFERMGNGKKTKREVTDAD